MPAAIICPGLPRSARKKHGSGRRFVSAISELINFVKSNQEPLIEPRACMELWFGDIGITVHWYQKFTSPAAANDDNMIAV